MKVFDIKVTNPKIIVLNNKSWIEVTLEDGENITISPTSYLIDHLGLREQLSAVDDQIRLAQMVSKNQTSHASKDKDDRPPR